MNLRRHSAQAVAGLAALTLSFSSSLIAQSPAADLHRAYYLQHEGGDLAAARELYEKVASDRRTPADVRKKANAMLRAATEELASADFARLVPADTIFYLECNRPGEQLRTLLDQLGLLGADAEQLGISPLLVEGVLGMRGVAVAITEIDPRSGPTGGVAILHPGDLEVVRGLIETVLPVGGQPVEPIGDYATYSIQGEAFVTLTERLLIAGRHRQDIASVIERMQNGGEGSMAENPQMAGAMSMRGDDLMFSCLNLQPVMPMILQMIEQQARRNPEMKAGLAFVDLPSARTLAGRAGVDESGLSFDLMIELDEGHRSLAFNLMRMPNIDEQAMSLVPSGSAFFCVGAVNRPGQVPPGLTDAEGKPVVTFMDFGRELFANVADVAAFVMPDVQQAPWGPMPGVGVAMRVNDPKRSLALWQFLLGTAQAASGGTVQVAEQKHGVVRQRFDIQGVPVFLAQSGNNLLLSPSSVLIDSAVASARRSESVLQDPAFADALAIASNGSTMVAAANLGRCAEIGKHFMSDRERREIEPFLGMMQNTSMSFGVLQTNNRIGVRGRIVGMPDVGPIVSQLVQHELHDNRARAASRRSVSVPAAPSARRAASSSRSRRATIRNGAASSGAAAPRPVEAKTPADAKAFQKSFEEAHAAGDVAAAKQIVLNFGGAMVGDPQAINDFAWNLLTKPQYGRQYDEVARTVSQVANEATNWGNWYYLDTFARALFQTGAIDAAIKMQKKAIKAGADDPRVGEARQALEEYLRAKKGTIK